MINKFPRPATSFAFNLPTELPYYRLNTHTILYRALIHKIFIYARLVVVRAQVRIYEDAETIRA